MSYLGLQAKAGKVLGSVCEFLHARHDCAVMAFCHGIHPCDHIKGLHAAHAARAEIRSQLPSSFCHTLICLFSICLKHLQRIGHMLKADVPLAKFIGSPHQENF